jgi:DNA-binding transcriptional LysR family regulator
MVCGNATMDLKDIDLNLLVALDILIAERSVTRAADRLCITQSAASATLARLRELFNDPLLVKQGRDLIATPVAQGLVAPVSQFLALVQSAFDRYRDFDPAKDRRTFSIVASDYATLLFLQPLMRTLSIEAPNIHLRIELADVNCVEQIRQLDNDLLIVPGDVLPDNGDFIVEPLFSDRYVCVVDADHPDIRSKITLQQFSALPYLATSFGTASSLVERQLDRLGISRNVEITTSGSTLAYFMLQGTRRISLLHEKLGKTVAKKLNLRLLEPPMRLNGSTESIVWMPHNRNDLGHQWLRERLMRHAVSLSATGTKRRTAMPLCHSR